MAFLQKSDSAEDHKKNSRSGEIPPARSRILPGEDEDENDENEEEDETEVDTEDTGNSESTEDAEEEDDGEDGASYQTELKSAQKRLAQLQRTIHEKKIPVMILLEGWGAAGKGAVISKLIAELDPRGFKVYTTGAPNDAERRYPPMRRFWTKIPEYGYIAVFDRSWYRDVSISAVEDMPSAKEMEQRFRNILHMEQQLTEDGYVLAKYFLKISKLEQKKRFSSLEDCRATRWRVTEDDWRHHRMYGAYKNAFREMIERTDTPAAPWHIINAKKKKDAILAVLLSVCETLEAAIAAREAQPTAAPGSIQIRKSPGIRLMPSPRLANVDTTLAIDETLYKERLHAAQNRLFELHNELYRQKIPLILVYEGWDAAGKGGSIKRLTEGLDPRGYEVIPISAPTPAEANRQYLWRFWNALPRDGHIAIFDRSWYGRVMVEKIEGLCTEAEWKRAFSEINQFEGELHAWGAIMLKLWLHIDIDEQLRRFEGRANTPGKEWKITEEDWRNRARWPEYEIAVNDMLQYTNTDYAPWVVVEGNDKKYARVKVIESVVAQIEYCL